MLHCAVLKGEREAISLSDFGGHKSSCEKKVCLDCVSSLADTNIIIFVRFPNTFTNLLASLARTPHQHRLADHAKEALLNGLKLYL